MNEIYSVGIDCEDFERWQSMLPKLREDWGNKLFSRREHSFCRASNNPALHYSLTWCLKEAVLKALSPIAEISLRQIEIEFGKASIKFHFKDFNKFSHLKIRGDVAYTKDTSIAVVIVQ